MSFWKRILGRDERFYDLLEASAAETKYGSAQLSQFLDALRKDASRQKLDELNFSKRNNKKITEELCRTFVTPLERENIEALSNSLYKIPKTVVKVGERLLIYQPNILQNEALRRQGKLLKQSAEVVWQLVQMLRSKAALGGIPGTEQQAAVFWRRIRQIGHCHAQGSLRTIGEGNRPLSRCG